MDRASEPAPAMHQKPRLKVYYDAACPRCLRDQARYRRLAGSCADSVARIDVNDNAEALRARGITPGEALQSLHLEDQDGHIHRGLDAYIRLMEPAPLLRPLARLLGLPGLKPLLERLYLRSVRRRLRRQGRLP
jgi:predicted DCC family thiol-disulfide oxidoreductase YuxK